MDNLHPLPHHIRLGFNTLWITDTLRYYIFCYIKSKLSFSEEKLLLHFQNPIERGHHPIPWEQILVSTLLLTGYGEHTNQWDVQNYNTVLNMCKEFVCKATEITRPLFTLTKPNLIKEYGRKRDFLVFHTFGALAAFGRLGRRKNCY